MPCCSKWCWWNLKVIVLFLQSTWRFSFLTMAAPFKYYLHNIKNCPISFFNTFPPRILKIATNYSFCPCSHDKMTPYKISATSVMKSSHERRVQILKCLKSKIKIIKKMCLRHELLNLKTDRIITNNLSIHNNVFLHSSSSLEKCPQIWRT